MRRRLVQMVDPALQFQPRRLPCRLILAAAGERLAEFRADGEDLFERRRQLEARSMIFGSPRPLASFAGCRLRRCWHGWRCWGRRESGRHVRCGRFRRRCSQTKRRFGPHARRKYVVQTRLERPTVFLIGPRAVVRFLQRKGCLLWTEESRSLEPPTEQLSLAGTG